MTTQERRLSCPARVSHVASQIPHSCSPQTPQTLQTSDRATRNISLPEYLKPIQRASYDEAAVQELWHEVREFCDTHDFPMAPSLPSSAPPAGLSRKPLSQYREENSIKIRVSVTGTHPPEPHFISLGHQPLPLQSADRLRMDKTQEDYEHFARTEDLDSVDGVNSFKIIEEVFFPHQLAAPYFKYLSTAISIGEISLEKQTTPLAQQHAKGETKSRTQSSATALRATTRRPNLPPISRHIASQYSSQSTLLSSAPLHSSCTETQGEFLERLLPHTTFWLRRPTSVVFWEIVPGVLEERYMFPYLTIVHGSEGEPKNEVVERAALIATCILSSHVKPIRSNGKYDELSAFLRHYVVIIMTGNPGFTVFEAKPGASSYLFSSIGSGKLSYDSGNFQLWLHRIHEWAVEVWKPNMMAAFSPQHLKLKDQGPETNGEDIEVKGNPAVDEASRDIEMWAAQSRDQCV